MTALWPEIGYEQLRTELDGGVLTVWLHRPEALNAYTPVMGRELLALLDRVDADDAVRSVVLTGSGKSFCAGADLRDGGPERFVYAGPEHEDFGGRVTLRVFASLKPMIVAVNGPAIGFGASVLLPADVRLASTRARFGYTFGRIGLIPEAASSWFLPRAVGISRAVEWATTARVFGADEAREAGLVRSVYEPEELVPAAQALAREMAVSAPVSVALIRQMMWRMSGVPDPTQAHRLDSRAMYERGRSADVHEGITAFLEKRAAEFPDRVSANLPDFYPWWPDQQFRPLGDTPEEP